MGMLMLTALDAKSRPTAIMRGFFSGAASLTIFLKDEGVWSEPDEAKPGRNRERKPDRGTSEGVVAGSVLVVDEVEDVCASDDGVDAGFDAVDVGDEGVLCHRAAPAGFHSPVPANGDH